MDEDKVPTWLQDLLDEKLDFLMDYYNTNNVSVYISNIDEVNETHSYIFYMN